MKTIRNITLLFAFLNCSHGLAYDSVIVSQIEDSSDFKSFYKKRWNELHSSKTKSPLEQCIHDQYERIDPNTSYGRPPKNEFIAARFKDYRGRTYKGPFVMTPLQACIRYHYLSEKCSDHHDQSVICNGEVFTHTGQDSYTPKKSINTGNTQKDYLQDSTINNAVLKALGH